jgi:hypothetical protein
MENNADLLGAAALVMEKYDSLPITQQNKSIKLLATH